MAEMTSAAEAALAALLHEEMIGCPFDESSGGYPLDFEHCHDHASDARILARRGVTLAAPAPALDALRRWHEALVMADCPDPDKHPAEAEAHLRALDELHAAAYPQEEPA